MPRISPALVIKARSIHPFLPLLLRQTRSLDLASAELRWLCQHVTDITSSKQSRQRHGYRDALHNICYRRSLGEPLQYLLKTQPFGSVEILCGKGALIPRSETEETVINLCKSTSTHLKLDEKKLRILDLCTGPGSIALLVASELYQSGRKFQILGVDVSDRALALAQKSLKYNIDGGLLNPDIRNDIGFLKADLLSPNSTSLFESIKTFFEFTDQDDSLDFVISNPPYVSSKEYWKDTSRSVRLFEPKLALVPPVFQALNLEGSQAGVAREDVFYPAIEQIATTLNAKAIIVETGGDDQCSRVKADFRQKGWITSTWKDFAGIERNVIAWNPHSMWDWLANGASD